MEGRALSRDSLDEILEKGEREGKERGEWKRGEVENEKEKVGEGEVRARLGDVRENVDNRKQEKEAANRKHTCLSMQGQIQVSICRSPSLGVTHPIFTRFPRIMPYDL